jgi:hypothetical protein
LKKAAVAKALNKDSVCTKEKKNPPLVKDEYEVMNKLEKPQRSSYRMQ